MKRRRLEGDSLCVAHSTVRGAQNLVHSLATEQLQMAPNLGSLFVVVSTNANSIQNQKFMLLEKLSL